MRRKNLYRYLILLAVTALWCGISYWGLLDFIEEQTINWRFQYRGEVPDQAKIFYIDVDAKSIADVGNLAWDRTYYAEVCQAVLQQGNATAIGIDYVFSERGMPEIADWERFHKGTLNLAKLLFAEKPPPIVLAAGYASAQDRDINGLPVIRQLPRVQDPVRLGQPPELPQFTLENRTYTPPNVGLIDTVDGSMNWVPIFGPQSGRNWFNIAIELTRLSWHLPPESLHVTANRLQFTQNNSDIRASVPLTHGQDVEVNWTTYWHSPQNPRVSFSEALTAARMLKSEKLDERAAAAAFFKPMNDSIVLIGPVDPLLQDRAPTRLDTLPVPRVGVIANLIRMFKSGHYIIRLSPPAQWLIIVALSACVCALLLIKIRRLLFLLKICAALLALAYAVSVFVVFDKTNIILPLVTPLGAVISVSFVLTSMLLIAAEQMRSRITGLFGTYVSPTLVDRMIASGEEPQLGGAEMPITAYFSDIQNFTRVAETLPPARLVEMMNDYLSTTTDVITGQEGTLDKYVGDAVVAMFGAPVSYVDHAARACVASQLAHAQIAEFRSRWAPLLPIPKVSIRTQIGINTGRAIVGNIGSRTRFNYTMMGDTVNVAARLQSAARLYGVHTLASGETRAAAEKYGDACLFRFLGKLIVKGRQHIVEVHEVMGLRDRLPPAALECSRIFAQGLKKYMARDWDGALVLFEQSSRLEWYPFAEPGNPTPSSVYASRCVEMKRMPPGPDWDGVYVMQSK